MGTDIEAREKFAIVGVGCRMPPNANSLAGFWKFLLRGGNASKPLKADRWDWRQWFDEDQQRPGKSYAAKASYLDADVRQFDPLAFGMSPREAESLDPQQRLLLESTWEAFEDAGLPLERMSGSSTGVFVGGFCLDHMVMQAQPSNRHLVNAHSAGGVMMTVLSNRISHAFNLHGPSLTLDTACSSSLVALHYACQSLRLRECDMALAGGVNVMTRPDFPIIMSKGHFLSPHGECHTFDETAAGYGRGEGAGILLLKRFSDAIAAGDPIHAVVRASGVNQDGHTDGISLPNSQAQEALIRQVYRDADLPFAEVDYVEAHGTGTQAGDSAELAALNKTFSEGRTRKLVVGSVKSNIGHLEAAAGVAGVLKTIGILKNRQIPKNLHFKKPNPKIPFADYCIEVVAKDTKTLPPATEKPTLYAAVNSFGYGGTNAHILLESAPTPEIPDAPEEKSALRLIPFSAQSDKALRDLAGKYAFQIGNNSSSTICDFSYSAAFRRSHLNYRGAALAKNSEELRTQLIATSTGEAHPGVVIGTQPAEKTSGLVFVYTGMGPQWWAMGQELIRTEPVVSASLDEIDVIFTSLAGWSLRDAMMAREADSRMGRTELAQPANFALQVGLTRLWEFYGIRPSAVVGHSVGEVVSAYVAGVYTLEEAVRVSYHRSRLQQTTAGLGSMLAVGLPEADAEKLLANAPGVSVAAINSFSAVTLSGDSAQLKEIAADLEKRGIFNKFLRVEVAYHSPQMDPLHAELLGVLADLAPKPAQLPLYSTACGKIVPSEDWSAEYWWHNVRQPVRFASATQALFEDGFDSFLEIGPHPVLGNSIKECAAHLERKIRCFVSLRRNEPELPRMLLTAGELYCAGYDPDWTALAPRAGRFLPGPQYPWQRETHWLESERSKMERLGLPGSVYLNRSVIAPNPCWEVEINRNYFPFLFDHRVQDQTVFAGMGYIEAALSLSEKIHEKPAVLLENVSFERVLIVDYSKLQYLVTEFDAAGGRFNIFSRTEGEEEKLLRHCRGRMLPVSEPRPATLNLKALKTACLETIPAEAFYERLSRRQLHYGPAFRPAVELFSGSGTFLLKIDTAAVAGENSHPLHPSIFDAALQAVIYCASGEELFVPFAIEQFHYFSRPDSAECYAFGKIISQTEKQIVADVWLADADGHVHAHARHLSLQALDLTNSTEEEDLFYESKWKHVPLDEVGEIEGSDILVLADLDDSDLTLARALAERLPGAALSIRETAGPVGFGEEAAGKFLAPYSNRHRIVVLWGSGEAKNDLPAIISLNEKVIGLLQALGTSNSGDKEIIFVTRGAVSARPAEAISNLSASSLRALGLTAQNEFPSVFSRSIDLDAGGSIDQVATELAAHRRGDIAYRDGQRFENTLPVHAQNPTAANMVSVSPDEPVELHLNLKGHAESLLFERIERKVPGLGEIELRIHRTALNDKDLLKIEGRLHPVALESAFWGSNLGMECSGVVTRCGAGSQFVPGDRVVTLLPRAFRTYATIPDAFAVKIPSQLDWDAAAIPVVYLAAYRGLVALAQLESGERILIHHATGGLGLASINLAQWIGAEIFATAGSDEKRQILRDLGIKHVFSSRDFDFAQQIREVTHHQGLDVVIGAQAGPARQASLNLLRTGGRYIEVGKKDIAEDLDLPLRPFNRNLTFASVDIDRLALERPALIQETLRKIFDHFEKGDFKQAATRTFPPNKLREAFTEMAKSRHVGKLLIDFSASEIEIVENTNAKSLIKRDGCYIITGGTSGFGLTTARWIAARGGGKIILVSRSGRKVSGIEEAIHSIAATGTQIEVLSVDVTDFPQVKSLLERAGAAPFTLRGIIHGAMVLDDALLSDLTEERFRKVFLPKVAGALNLAQSLTASTQLDFLAFYSSISALVGNPGQTNYVAANSFLDSLAHTLKARGIPAISINWGALAESGVVARDERISAALSSGGITGLGNQQALDALEHVIRSGLPQLGVFLMDWEKWHSANPKLADDPRFREQKMRSQKGGGNDTASQIRKELADFSKEQRLRALEEHLKEVLANTLRMSKDAVSMNRKLNEMGVDSLMVLELSLSIKDRIGLNFSAMEFLKGPNLQQLAALAESRLWNN